jgi:hypothetical protein
MKRLYFIVFISFVFFAAGAKGQDNGHGGVVVHTDPRLALLLKKSKAIASVGKVPKTPKATDVNAVTPIANATAKTPLNATVNAINKTTVKETKTKQAPVMAAFVSARQAKTVSSGKGFRVQIYNGPDRGKAMDIKAEFMRNNPGVRTYLTYISPCFRVKIGDYRNRSDAAGMLREAKSTYTAFMIVPDIIIISTF